VISKATNHGKPNRRTHGHEEGGSPVHEAQQDNGGSEGANPQAADADREAPEPGQPDTESPMRRQPEPAGGLPEEDDDNPYQGSDEALPDDTEERVISRNPGKEGGRFDEV
jgi:hypothetical protein